MLQTQKFQVIVEWTHYNKAEGKKITTDKEGRYNGEVINGNRSQEKTMMNHLIILKVKNKIKNILMREGLVILKEKTFSMLMD